MSVHSPVVHRFAPGATSVVAPPPAFIPPSSDELLIGSPAAVDDLTDATTIFVHPSGNDGAAGTWEAPKATLAAGLSAAVSSGRANIALNGGDRFRLTATTSLGSAHNGKTIRAFGVGKPIITGGVALTNWVQHPKLGAGYYLCTDQTPANRACFIISISGRRYPMAARFTSYNDYSGQYWSDGWKDARQAMLGLREPASTGSDSSTKGRFDDRNGESITADDINVDGLNQDLTWLACKKRTPSLSVTNGYWMGGELLDASTYNAATKEFTCLGSESMWFSYSSTESRREKFSDTGGVHGALYGNYNWLTYAANPAGSYAWDPTENGIVVKWPAGLSDLQSRDVELGLFTGDLFDINGSTVSLRDLIIEGNAMNGLYLEDSANFAAGIRLQGNNSGGSISGCAIRNLPLGIYIVGSNASKTISNNLFRDNEMADIKINSDVANQTIDHNEFAHGFTFNRPTTSIECFSDNFNLIIEYNDFHPSWGSSVRGKCGDTDGYTFRRNRSTARGRSLFDDGVHYMVRRREAAGVPSSGYACRAYENLFDECYGEAEFHTENGIVTPIPREEVNNVGGMYWDNGADYWQSYRNFIIGHGKHAIKNNAFNAPVEGATVNNNVVVTMAGAGFISDSYDALRVNQVFSADIDVESNFFILQNHSKLGSQDFLNGGINSGTRRNNAVCHIEQPSGWSGEAHIDDRSTIWDVADTPGAIKATCACFDAPVSLWAGFQPGGSFWTELAKAGFA